MRDCPCRHCERKGCGNYHDSCTEYQEWSKENREESIRRCAEKESQYTNNPNKKQALRKKMRWK